jgi:hypothetical protein
VAALSTGVTTNDAHVQPSRERLLLSSARSRFSKSATPRARTRLLLAHEGRRLRGTARDARCGRRAGVRVDTAPSRTKATATAVYGRRGRQCRSPSSERPSGPRGRHLAPAACSTGLASSRGWSPSSCVTAMAACSWCGLYGHASRVEAINRDAPALHAHGQAASGDEARADGRGSGESRGNGMTDLALQRTCRPSRTLPLRGRGQRRAPGPTHLRRRGHICAATRTTVVATSTTPPIVNAATSPNGNGACTPSRIECSSSRWRKAPNTSSATASTA